MNRRLSILGYDLYSRFIRFISANGFAILPPLIIFEPTYKCNLRCKMCTLYGAGGEAPVLKGEMSISEIKKVFSNIKKSYLFFLPRIHLTGGEPLLHNNFSEIIEYLKKLGFTYSITTNFAFLSEKILNTLVEYPPNDLRISIDGPAEIHDYIRGFKGTFSKVMQNLEKAKKAGVNAPLRFNCTISKDNIDYLDQVIKIARKFNAQLNFQHLMFLDNKHIKLHHSFFENTFGCKAYPMGCEGKISMDEANKIVEKIKKIKEIGKDSTFLPDLKLREIKPYYLELDNYTHFPYCYSVWSLVRIAPNGKVYPCFEYFFGDLKKDPLGKIWNSEKAKKFRKILKKARLFPGCIRCCKI